MQWQVQAWTSALSRGDSTAQADRCDNRSTQWSDCMWRRIPFRGWSWCQGSRGRGPKHFKKVSRTFLPVDVGLEARNGYFSLSFLKSRMHICSCSLCLELIATAIPRNMFLFFFSIVFLPFPFFIFFFLNQCIFEWRFLLATWLHKSWVCYPTGWAQF